LPPRTAASCDRELDFAGALDFAVEADFARERERDGEGAGAGGDGGSTSRTARGPAAQTSGHPVNWPVQVLPQTLHVQLSAPATIG
jgi:hypothetical protein